VIPGLKLDQSSRPVLMASAANGTQDWLQPWDVHSGRNAAIAFAQRDPHFTSLTDNAVISGHVRLRLCVRLLAVPDNNLHVPACHFHRIQIDHEVNWFTADLAGGLSNTAPTGVNVTAITTMITPLSRLHGTQEGSRHSTQWQPCSTRYCGSRSCSGRGSLSG
jgi:hypothetical protein